MGKPKITILWSKLSGYFNECLKQLAGVTDDLIVVRRSIDTKEAPFADTQFNWIKHLFDYQTQFAQAVKAIEAQKPDILIVCGWYNPNYVSLAKHYKSSKTLVISTCDNPWRGTWRQHVASLTAPLHVKAYFDKIWVTGSQAAYLVTKLGFSTDQIWTGLYTCNVPAFDRAYQQRQVSPYPKVFLFVGRYIEQKGLKTLLLAYNHYRTLTSTPWQLWLVGSGPLGSEISDGDGVRNWGFTQPHELPKIFSQAGAFVLPSYHESWGVVIHEAATAGLPIICTTTCGSAPELVHSGKNGQVVPPQDVEALTQAMLAMTQRDQSALQSMAIHSRQLAKQYSPQQWLKTLISGYNNYLQNIL